MSEIIVRNSGALCGDVTISGSKNSSLPILAACILTKGKNIIQDIPKLSDIEVMYDIIEGLGGKIDIRKHESVIDCENINEFTTPYELVGKLRGSFLLAGPLLSRFGKARISMPGGCPIGTRPIDLHLKGFSALGAKV
ncbi:MAG: UDP-N-acetylglucosamine 1-carboxyvinyltransferase, partial [Clostridia bacterium]|nr:UDP-N-acetylglucosamine 1-carboxyvinyltransferase [Clostridia bacterium]